MLEKRVRKIGFTLLGIYSISLILTEIFVSQEYARHYFTDIRGPVRFYAINTTLSVFLMWSTALIFLLIIYLEEDRLQPRNLFFYSSQIFIFFSLGIDDRFLFHEWIGSMLGINDAFLLFGLGGAELILLFTWPDLRSQRVQTKAYLSIAALFFGCMVIIDGFFMDGVAPRLSLEDLTKTWAALFLFLFAWDIHHNKIRALKQMSS